ncbi:WbuC family cupin fold metalloprotein [Paludibacterium yongneupense]|uniref:WbuC family cupin fold metalloprotein n=1 Tax=Paludibacterium yongneupense TaxID=400061 RepID=UPI00040316BE|nr:WbuC family cupin fold metalloprotein [Paludibacterium yongneupense]
MKSLVGDGLDKLSQTAAQAPRLRSNLNFHAALDEPVQRLVIAMEPGTYVRPHRHASTWELLSVQRGAMELITFDADGALASRQRLGENGACVVEMPAGTWHSVLSLETGSAVLEVKQGPYRPLGDEDLAAWSPAEGSPAVADMLHFLSSAAPGDRFIR